MRKILLVFSIVFICNGLCSAQEPHGSNSSENSPEDLHLKSVASTKPDTNYISLEKSHNDLQSHFKSAEDQITNNTSVLFIIKIVVGAIIALIIILFIFLTEYIKKITYKSKRLEQKFVMKGDILQGNKVGNVNMFEDKLQNLERKFGVLLENYNKLLKLIDPKDKLSESRNNKNLSFSDEKFFKTKNGKTLLEELVSRDESSFRVFDINDNKAKFEYCGKIVNTDFFDGVCQFLNNPLDVPDKTKILTTIPGVVKKNINGDWTVESQAQIKFL